MINKIDGKIPKMFTQLYNKLMLEFFFVIIFNVTYNVYDVKYCVTS